MLNRLRQTFYYLKRPAGIVEALKGLTSPQTIDLIAATYPPALLISQVAEAMPEDEEKLLFKVAKKLSLEPLFDFTIPSTAVVQRTGHSAAALSKIFVLPQLDQSTKAGYSIVVADPSKINLEEFKREGIRVYLGLGQRIENCWQKFSENQRKAKREVTEAQIFAVLKQLASDSSFYGAEGVYVGAPDEESYEFFTNGKRYQGKLHKAVYPTICRLLANSNRIKKAVDVGDLSSLIVCFSQRTDRKVIFLTWEKKSSTLSKPQHDSIQTGTIESSDKNPPQQKAQVYRPPFAKRDRIDADYSNSTEEQDIVLPKILLVDDDERFSLILGRMLEGKGFNIHTINNSEKALEQLLAEEIRPDLIICDVHMPVMDGVNFLSKLRETRLDLPVLMLTSDEDQTLQAELAMLGADCFVNKQQDPKILIAWAMNIINRRLGNKAGSPLGFISGFAATRKAA